MSISFGFYNSLNHDRMYNSYQISHIFDGIINDGVYDSIGTAFVVKAGTGLTLNVGIGRAWFNHTWTLNDAILPVILPDADLILSRIDAIVLEINATESSRANSVKIIQGTPATEPVRPTLTKTDYIHQYPLCYVAVAANATSIIDANITNMVGTDECPFVTGIIKSISMDTLLGQWRSELDQFAKDETADFNTWFQSMKDQLSTDAAGNLQAEINTLTTTTQNLSLKLDTAGIFTIPAANWSSTTTPMSGIAYYTYQLPLTHFYLEHPRVSVSGANDSTLPTATEQEMYNLVKYTYVTEDALTSTPTGLIFYADTKPKSNFFVLIEGAN